MTALHTIVAIVPAAQGVECTLAAYGALPLADESKLVGLFVSPIAVSYGLGFEAGQAEFIAMQMEAVEDEQKAAKAEFARACASAGIDYEWRAENTVGDLVSPRAGSMARAADVILYPRLSDEASLGRHQIEEVVFTSGRPVLAVPAGWSGSALGRNVLIAWDGGREATRAVFDAMPFLLKAQKVRIVSIQGISSDPVRQFTPGDDLAATLSRHGIRAESLALRSSRQSVKEELQQQVLDIGADMVVMGCYGHSRFRELVLGGVSRDMLKEVPFPLLLSN